jgi:hypothetical protein
MHMALPSTYMRVTLNYEHIATGAKATNTLWYLPASSIGTVTLANIVTFANDFKTAFTAAVGGALHDGCRVYKVTAKWVAAGAEFEADNTNGPIAGTVGGDLLPEEVVMCIQRRTGKQGRSMRGRIFFPFISSDFNLNGELTGPGQLAAGALAIMVKNTLTANSVSMAPQTLNHKLGQLNAVVQSGYPTSLCSRRDRRYPKQLAVIRV